MIYSLAIALLAYGVHWYRTGYGISPDGLYYQRPPGQRPLPYSLRWLWPALCGTRRRWWVAVSLASLVAAAALLPARGAWLLVWLPMVALNVRLPVLVDAPAFALALGSAALAPTHPALSVALALAAGASKESAPVFAAAWSWSPWPLLGLVAAGWWRARAAPDQPWLKNPWKTARRDPLEWRRVLLPWGALLPLAVAGGWSRAATASMVLGYAQTLRSMDDARLYQWAAPALLPLACRAEGWWVWPLLALHPFICATHRGT